MTENMTFGGAFFCLSEYRFGRRARQRLARMPSEQLGEGEVTTLERQLKGWGWGGGG